MADAANHESVTSATAAPAAKLSRRQLVKAGAWAAPAVAITVAAPMAAAVSITPTTAPTLSATRDGNSTTWNVTLNVLGTASAKAWTVAPTISGAVGTWDAALPSTTAAVASYIRKLTLTQTGTGAGLAQAATLSVRLIDANGTFFDTNSVPMTPPVSFTQVSPVRSGSSSNVDLTLGFNTATYQSLPNSASTITLEVTVNGTVQRTEQLAATASSVAFSGNSKLSVPVGGTLTLTFKSGSTVVGAWSGTVA